MPIEQILQDEIQESKRWIDTAEGVYKRDLVKRIELINWILDNMKNPDTFVCQIIETKMNEIIDKINRTNDSLEADPLHSELRMLDWIFYQVCSNELKKFESYNIN
jgi:hypothetical protein